MANAITKITHSAAINAIPPHSGAVTHHQDQSITSVNFNTKNVINNKPKKLIPPPAVLLLAITSNL